MSPTDVRVVFCTCPADAAELVARRMVELRLAACVNVLPGIQSYYWWEGKIAADGESLLVLKCRAGDVPALEDAIRSVHPYELPEVIAFDVAAGSGDYLKWVIESTDRSASGDGA